MNKARKANSSPFSRNVSIAADGVRLPGELAVPPNASGVVVFVHGSGSSRLSPRNRFVAEGLNSQGLGTLLFDLLTEDEEQRESYSRHLRFDISLLAARLLHVTAWLKTQPEAHNTPLGYFGSSTGGAAALVAAAELPDGVQAVVVRGGRPDLAGECLGRVQAPALLIVGGRDLPVIDVNEDAFRDLRCEKLLRIIPGATHLFEEPGTLEQVARLAAEWFDHYFSKHSSLNASVGTASLVHP